MLENDTCLYDFRMRSRVPFSTKGVTERATTFTLVNLQRPERAANQFSATTKRNSTYEDIAVQARALACSMHVVTDTSFDLAVVGERMFDNGIPPKPEGPMLVLSRKLGEKIVIGDNIVVTVVKIDRNQIRIGIEAPIDVPVYRQEIAPNRVEKTI